MRAVQLISPENRRQVAMVDEPHLVLLADTSSLYDLAQAAIASGGDLSSLIASRRSSTTLNYDEVYQGASGWHWLPAFDHPTDPHRCMLSGTGLTHTWLPRRFVRVPSVRN